MARMRTKMPAALFSAVAWGTLAVTIAGFAAPTVAEAAAPPSERGERTQRGEGRNARNVEQFRARMNERAAAARPQQREAQPMPRARVAAEPRRSDDRPRGNWRGGDDRPRAEADRSPARSWRSVRAPNESAPREVRTVERPRVERGERERSWSENRQAPAWRQDRRDADRNDRRETYRTDRRDNWRGDTDRDRSTWRDRNYRNDDRRDYRDARRWDRSGWRRDNRYDWRHYRDRNRTIYRTERYYAPYRSYSYRRLGIGFSLGPLFYGSRYWIDDPWYYRLPPVYGPYRWVRYYDDVLLVNIYTGEVVDVIYDFFW